MAHQHARVVSRARVRARVSACSVNVPTGHTGSVQVQVRLRQRSRTARPNAGMSTRSWTLRPWLSATTPHARHPIVSGIDSTVTINPLPPSSRVTATTWKPSRPTSTSQRSQYGEEPPAGRQHNIGSGIVEVLAERVSLVASDPGDLDPHLTASRPYPACPTPPPQVRRARFPSRASSTSATQGAVTGTPRTRVGRPGGSSGRCCGAAEAHVASAAVGGVVRARGDSVAVAVARVAEVGPTADHAGPTGRRPRGVDPVLR